MDHLRSTLHRLSRRSHAINFPKMKDDAVEQRLEDGMAHLRFACRLYKRQVRRGNVLLHEHPRTTRLWDETVVKRILNLPGVGTAITDQCAFGLQTKTDDGGLAYALKPTMCMSNSPIMLQELTRRCDRSHDHQALMSGRASTAEKYPLDLVLAIIRGRAKTNEARQRMITDGIDNWENILSMTTCTNETRDNKNTTVDVPASRLPCANGYKIDINVGDANAKTHLSG